MINSDIYASAVRAVFKPIRRQDFLDYVSANAVLSRAENRDHAGKYNAEMVLPMARLFDDFERGAERGKWQELIVCKGAQSGFSAHALLSVMRELDYDPSNTVVVSYRQDEAVDLKARLNNFLEGNGNFSHFRDADVSAVDRETLLQLTGSGWNVWFTGSGSAGALAAKPGVKRVVVDELDKHKVIAGEPGSLDALRQRGKAIKGSIIIAGCTPTTENGPIWTEFLAGSRHRYFVPCPFCDHLQILLPDRLRWDHHLDILGVPDLEGVRVDTKYACENCDERIGEEHKLWMLTNGSWRPTNYRAAGSAGSVEDLEKEGERRDLRIGLNAYYRGGEGTLPNWPPGVMSAHISDLYGRWDNSSWGNLAVDFITSQSDMNKRKALITNGWGEPFAEQGMRKVKHSDIFRHRGDYNRGQCPLDPDRVLFAADTQDHCFKWGLGVVDAARNLYIIDWGESQYILGGTDALDAIALKGVEWDGEGRRADIGLIDEGGHRQAEVRKSLVSRVPWLNPVHGAAGREVRNLVWSSEWTIDPDEEAGDRITVYRFDDPSFKRDLYIGRILGKSIKAQRSAGDGYVSAPQRKPSIQFPRDVDAQFAEELSNEHLEKTINKKTGKVEYRWIQRSPNDYGDVCKMLLVAESILRMA